MEQAKPRLGAVTYLREVVTELKKVVWPTRSRVIRLTGVVVTMVTLIAFFLFLVDYPLSILMQKVFLRK
jgi:preprotein translocase subunit SecE